MLENQAQALQEIKDKIKSKYVWLQDSELDDCLEIAVADYITIRYPSSNNRPAQNELVYDFTITHWLYLRMLDILGRAGGISVTAYKENNLNLTYGGSMIDPQLVAMIMPKAGVPK